MVQYAEDSLPYLEAVDGATDGPASSAPALEGAPPRPDPALDEINRKLDLLLHAQGISM